MHEDTKLLTYKVTENIQQCIHYTHFATDKKTEAETRTRYHSSLSH